MSESEIKTVEGQACTWSGCNTKQAYKTMIAEDGSEWAHLCRAHYDQFEEIVEKVNVDGGNIARLIGAWVAAQGGEKRATERTIRLSKGKQ